MTTNLEYCNYYSDRGWRVFLCGADKKPLVKAWQNEATTDKARIAEWWGANPNGAIGLATGKQSGVFVVDVDAGHGGFDTLSKLPPMPETVISNTGGGGKHYIFNYPGFELRNTAGKIGEGIDTRAEGGYIIAPKSPHPSGHFYEWDKQHLPSKVAVADAPDWLLKLLIEDKTQQPTSTGASDGAYISGQRNNAMTSLAGAMRRRNMSEEAIFLALNAENLNRCIPPLPETEIRMIAASVSRYDASAAMPLTNKDRAQAEWSFVRCVYEWPNSANEFQSIQPLDFGQKELADFWQSVNAGIDVTAAAANCGILSEIEKYTDYIHGHMEGYAKQIKQFSYQARIVKHAETLKHHAISGNNLGIEKALNDINKIPSQVEDRVLSICDIADNVEKEIRERALNPVDVWGIPYAWSGISKLTGGKQKGELTLFPSEPKVGKSWWNLQDALYTAIAEIPVFYWCGEMRRNQLMRRFYQLLGVSGRRMKSGSMSQEDWRLLDDAKAIILNSPLYIDDTPLSLHEVRSLLKKQKSENGIQQAIFDYARLIQSPGKDENEQSKAISIEMKRICQELDIAITLIASVNKMGMDSKTEFATKSNVSGSGQQIHDADNTFIMTKFNGSKYGQDYGIQPHEYDSIKMLHLSASRELDHHIENGFLLYKQNNSPKFEEVTKT